MIYTVRRTVSAKEFITPHPAKIKQISIAKVASYNDQPVIIKPEKYTFIYGLNGCGKTVISKYIANPEHTDFASCSITYAIGTIFEITCPILLTFGFTTRLATLPLLAMTAVIQFTYDQNIQHSYWAMLLGTILCLGAGKISVDYYFAKYRAN